VLIKDKDVLVTGGTSGIGLALVRQLAAKGARIVILARSIDRLDEVCAELEQEYPGICQFFSVDVSQADQVYGSISKIVEGSGIPDIVINSAGVAHPGYVQDLDLEIFHWMMDVNYFGTVHVIKALLPGMIERGSGHIVNIGSMNSIVGGIGYSAYGASKFALRGFSDALRMEMKPYGINVSFVYPADTDTPQLEYENKYKPEELKKILKMVPAWDPIPPEKVAEQIIKGIEREQEVILPDFGMVFFFKFINLLGRGIYPLTDWLYKRARDNPNIEVN
jgi:3-dehydrosphinganine reductase